MNLLRFIGYANSNQLQTEIKRRFENGFVFQGFYTFQKTLTTSEGSNNSFGNLQMLPAALTNNAPTDQRLQAIYANDSGLPRHTLSFNANYELPFGRGKKFGSSANGLLNRLISGWNMSGFYYWRSGLFFSPYYSVGGSNTVLAPGKNGILPADQRSADRWFDAEHQSRGPWAAYNGETFIRRANPLENDYLNNVPRDYMTGPGFYNIDSSFYKVTPITERVRLRIEARSSICLTIRISVCPTTPVLLTQELDARVSFSSRAGSSSRFKSTTGAASSCAGPFLSMLKTSSLAILITLLARRDSCRVAAPGAELILPSTVLNRDGLVPVTFRTARQITGNGTLTLKWTDSLGRVVEDRTIPVTLTDEDQFTFTLDLRRAVAMRNELNAHFSITGRNLKVERIAGRRCLRHIHRQTAGVPLDGLRDHHVAAVSRAPAARTAEAGNHGRTVQRPKQHSAECVRRSQHALVCREYRHRLLLRIPSLSPGPNPALVVPSCQRAS